MGFDVTHRGLFAPSMVFQSLGSLVRKHLI